ncbi:GH25 family lysozyme [Lacticaseibacillus mingshuiensis]|uniref:GH25 family lysozyme n=1 Tax=Lacticaseibacillus mingshuiensis TaxID=2799574 RepID=A0ABW4CFA0_9LACO|nr:GH25 family lysozyme [Lacticaseibacillus mingshuiensis]
MPRKQVKPIYADTYQRHHRRLVLAGSTALVVAALLVLVVVVMHLQKPPALRENPVQGVVLSQDDATQDFSALKKAGLRFAYLKTTEGASYFDDRFAANYDQSRGGQLAIGVYHQFSFDSTPAAQAQHFIAKVGHDIGTLPIGIALSYYGDYAEKPPAAATFQRDLTTFINLLQAHYNRVVILMGSVQVLRAVSTVAPSAGRWVTASAKPAQAQYWQYGSGKIAGQSLTRVAFLGTVANFANQSNKTVR